MGEKELMNQFKEAVANVVRIGEEVSRLQHETQQSEAEVLEDIIRTIRPVMPLIDEQVENEHGIVLLDKFTLKESYSDRESRSEFGGFQIVLTSDGKILRMDRSGEWSSLTGKDAGWSITKKELTFMETAGYGLNDLVGSIVQAFREAMDTISRKKEELEGRKALIEEAQSVLGTKPRAGKSKWDPLA